MEAPITNQLKSLSANRIQRELAEMTTDPPPNVSAGPKGDNLYQWAAAIAGPSNSPYEGGIFFIDILFPQDYPFQPPQFTYRTKIYHCNINQNGKLSLEKAITKWSPSLTIHKLLTSLCSLLCGIFIRDFRTKYERSIGY
jgi:ubiquitin-protein ligase